MTLLSPSWHTHLKKVHQFHYYVQCQATSLCCSNRLLLYVAHASAICGQNPFLSSKDACSVSAHTFRQLNVIALYCHRTQDNNTDRYHSNFTDIMGIRTTLSETNLPGDNFSRDIQIQDQTHQPIFPSSELTNRNVKTNGTWAG